jgi:ureidoacrylate peracid hydrolase
MDRYTALLAIDLQNGFCHPDGSVVGVAGPLWDVDRVVGQAARAVDRARSLGLPVIFTRHCYQPGYANRSLLNRAINAQIEAVGGLLAGTWDAEIVDVLGRRPDDLVIDKCRPDSFFGTPLATILSGLGVDHLVVAGVVTNVCIESTIRGAYMRDLECTLLADCCTTLSEEDHRMAVTCLGRYEFARIADLDHGFEDLGSSVTAPAVPA